MRISDWSADVCSSDLGGVNLDQIGPVGRHDIHPLHRRIEGVLEVIELIDRAGALDTRGGHRRLDLRRDVDERGGVDLVGDFDPIGVRSEEHTSELQSLMRISYDVFCLKKNIQNNTHNKQFISYIIQTKN